QVKWRIRFFPTAVTTGFGPLDGIYAIDLLLTPGQTVCLAPVTPLGLTLPTALDPPAVTAALVALLKLLTAQGGQTRFNPIIDELGTPVGASLAASPNNNPNPLPLLAAIAKQVTLRAQAELDGATLLLTLNGLQPTFELEIGPFGPDALGELPLRIGGLYAAL